MNNSQGPPLHYPSLRDSTTIEIFRPPPPTAIGSGGGTGPRFNYARRVCNFSRNESSRFQPPAYGADSCPPRYQDPPNGHRRHHLHLHHHHNHHEGGIDGRGSRNHLVRTFSHYHRLVQQHQARQLSQSSQLPPQVTRDPPGGDDAAGGCVVIIDEEQQKMALERRKTMKIRLAASLSIVLVVALVVAGTVGKITSMQKHGYYLGGDGNLRDGHESAMAMTTGGAKETDPDIPPIQTQPIAVVTSTPESSLQDSNMEDYEDASMEVVYSEATPSPTGIEYYRDKVGLTDTSDDELEPSSGWLSDWESVTPDDGKKIERDLEGQAVFNEWGDCG